MSVAMVLGSAVGIKQEVCVADTIATTTNRRTIDMGCLPAVDQLPSHRGSKEELRQFWETRTVPLGSVAVVVMALT